MWQITCKIDYTHRILYQAMTLEEIDKFIDPLIIATLKETKEDLELADI